jgi:hypothetical protein
VTARVPPLLVGDTGTGVHPESDTMEVPGGVVVKRTGSYTSSAMVLKAPVPRVAQRLCGAMRAAGSWPTRAAGGRSIEALDPCGEFDDASFAIAGPCRLVDPSVFRASMTFSFSHRCR